MVAVGLVSPIGAWVHKGSAAGEEGGRWSREGGGGGREVEQGGRLRREGVGGGREVEEVGR